MKNTLIALLTIVLLAVSSVAFAAEFLLDDIGAVLLLDVTTLISCAAFSVTVAGTGVKEVKVTLKDAEDAKNKEDRMITVEIVTEDEDQLTEIFKLLKSKVKSYMTPLTFWKLFKFFTLGGGEELLEMMQMMKMMETIEKTEQLMTPLEFSELDEDTGDQDTNSWSAKPLSLTDGKDTDSESVKRLPLKRGKDTDSGSAKPLSLTDGKDKDR